MLKKIFSDCFTGIDNQTHDLGKVLWALFSLALIIITFILVLNGTIKSITEIATAYGIGMGAGGGTILLKKSTEPTKPNG